MKTRDLPFRRREPRSRRFHQKFLYDFEPSFFRGKRSVDKTLSR